MKNTLLVNLDFDLIQQIRLVHALAESDFRVAIRSSEMYKFSILEKEFGISLFSSSSSEDNGEFDITANLRFCHEEPQTTIGSLSRHLIFPSEVSRRCRSIWNKERTIPYSFQGLITRKRKALISSWVEKNISNKHKISDTNSWIQNLRRKVLSKAGLDYTVKKKMGDLLLWSSDKGRSFPGKTWDKEYFEILSNSRYVLCPSGDYTWSYRFFEAILCGAIPIVEEVCEAYEGFKFFLFKDSIEELECTQEYVEHNYELCTTRLTIPKAVLNQELANIMSLTS